MSSISSIAIMSKLVKNCSLAEVEKILQIAEVEQILQIIQSAKKRKSCSYPIYLACSVMEKCSLAEIEQILEIVQNRYSNLKNEAKPTNLDQIMQSLDSCTNQELDDLIAKIKARRADLDKDTIKPGEAHAKVVSAKIGQYWVNHINNILNAANNSTDQPVQTEWQIYPIPNKQVRLALANYYNSRGYKARLFSDERVDIEITLDVDVMTEAMNKASK